ncbi:MAG: hypothetical protein WC356_00640 [Candidatus Micrarchaeia archaeon]|jgi:hypothetical protein
MNYKIIFALLIFLFYSVNASCGYVFPSITENWLLPTIIAALLALGIIIIIYMIGKLTENPRLNVWAQTEISQVILSIIIAALIFSGMYWFYTESSALTLSAGIYKGTSPYVGGSIYETSCEYLSDLAEYSNDVMSLIRYNIAVANIRGSLNEFGCKTDEIDKNPYGCAMAFLGGPSTSWNKYSSNYNYLSLFNTSLNIATICFFNTLFLLYLLQFILTADGFLFILLPAGIIIRTIPFLRGLGGSLIAIAVGLFLFLPFMITLEALIFGDILQAEHSSFTYPDESSLENDLWPISLGDLGEIIDWNTVPEFSTNLEIIFKATTHIFLAGVFLPYLGFAGVIIVTRDLSKLLGEEVDISRLAQMV